MHDLLESILPRTYLSDLDDEVGVVDVGDLAEILVLEADERVLSATNVVLQKKFATKHVGGAPGVFASYCEMLSEIEDLNDWQPEGRELTGCSLRTFVNRISALEAPSHDEAGCDTDVVRSTKLGSPELGSAELDLAA
jgi:hypothetical protein